MSIHLFPLGESIPEVAVLERQLSDTQRELRRVKSKETVQQQQEDQLRRENYELTQGLLAARREIETLNTAKAAMEHSLTQQLTQRDGELWRLNSEISSIQQKLQCSTLEQEKLTALRHQEKQLHRENSELTQGLAAAKREIETLKSEKAALGREHHSLTQQLTQRDNELWRLNSEISSLQQNLHQLKNRCSALEGEN